GQHLSVDEISEIVGATQLYSVVHGAHEGVEQMCEATMQLVETSYWHTILGKVSKSLELNVICASLVEFGSACAATYQKVAKAADWLDKGVAATVSSAGNAFDYASKLPPEQLRYLTRPAAGFAKGAGGSVSGLFHVVCHPLETVKDLAQMAGNIAYFMVDYFPLPRVAEFALTGRIDEVKELWRAHRAKYGPKEAALKQLVIAEWAKPMPEKLHDIALVAGHLMTDYYMIGRFCQVIKTVRRGKPWVCRTNLGHPEAAKDVCDLFCNNAGVFFEEETSVMRGVSFTHEGKTVTRGCTGKGYRKLSMHEALEDMGHKVKGSGKKGCPIAQSIQRGGASPEQSARLAKYASSYESKWADTIWAKRRGFNGKPFKKLYKIAADNGLLIQRQNSLIMPVGESFRRLVINFNDQIRCPVVLQKQGASRFRVNSQSLFKVEASELKKNSIHGGHIDPGGLYRRIGLLDYEVEHIDLVSGMTRALVKTTNGVTQTKLMFPTSWSGEVILDQIAQGCCNIDKTIACGDGSFNIECSTNAGLRMQMHVDQSGTIRTCTPLESTATYWATPEAFKVFRSSLQHNATNLAPTPAEKMALQILRKRFSGDELARFTLEDHLGEAGVVARLNSQLRLYDTGCGIVPINKCVEYDEYFVILFEKFYAKQSILLHSQAGIAGLYEGLEVEVNVAHVFNHKYKRKKISGGHWDRNSGLKKSGILEVEDIKKGIDGCYKGNAKLLNRSFYDGKSYFGDDWTAEQIAQALCEALENITSVELEKGALHKMYGRTKMGLEIEMMARYKNGKIYVNSFYPKIN
ncbi:EndoU domain-containing protein, partial [bacterium]|nr:EndoU domain-containing protein [bacterium]